MTISENITNDEKTLKLTEIGVKELLDAGIHFGHEKTKWNPKMKTYIHSSRKGIHIIDITQTLTILNSVCKYVKNLSAKGGTILMLATKKQSQLTIKSAAEKSKSQYVISRWLGGTLTNFDTIFKRIKHLNELENQQNNEQSTIPTKKEQTQINKKINRLNKFFEGLKKTNKIPDCLYVIDVKKEKIAINEANILNIPVIGLVDSDSDPTGIDYIIPGNDDSIRSIKLISNVIADALSMGLGEYISSELERDYIISELNKEEHEYNNNLEEEINELN